MHKHLSARVVAAAIIFIIASFGIAKVGADGTSPWINSTVSVTKQADTTSLPTTLSGNGNIDCAMEDAANCSVAAAYGAATQNSTARLNSSGSFLPVTTYIDSRQHFYPVPNSGTAISYFSGPVYGLDLAFNYNLSSSITKTGSGYTINKPPDGKLSDKANRLLAADIASMSFSQNGRWMVVSDPNTAMLRVNMDTFEALPFAVGFNYSIGLDPGVKTAITNDGRYAVIASKNFTTFRLYNLSTCGVIPSTIIGPVTCQSRDLNSVMQQQFPAFSFAASMRFADDNTLDIYSIYKSGAINRTGRFVISAGASSNQIQYLALGDSYIVGQGAFDYQGGTDTASNKCHLSFLAYPYLIGHDLNYNSYHSVACSGALTNDITNTSESYTGQADDKKIKRSDRPLSEIDSILASFTPGYIDQMDFVAKYQPQMINLSVGGNDTGFANILKGCVDPRKIGTCYSTYEDRLELVRQINSTVFPRLLQTYQKLKAAGPPDMRIYIIGYPQIAKPGGDCGLNVHLNSDEVLFSQELINYLDEVIQTAAARTGVYYVDTQDALNGFRLCEAGPGAIAVNGLTAGNDTPSRLGGPIGDESYHPNATGYQLLENKILSDTHNLTAAMPTASLSAALPAENGLVILNVPKSGRTINTIEPDNAISADLAYRGTSIDISIDGAGHSLPPTANLKAEIHSTPISLGAFTTSTDGSLHTQIVVPASTPTGYHSLHFYGTAIAGQPVDIYKVIYVGSTADDIDGDGIADSTQKCVGIIPSGQDFDKDGIDDACDANITQPPSSPPTATPNDKPSIPTTIDDTNSASLGSENFNNQAPPQATGGKVLAAETAADPMATGIDTRGILTSAASSSLSSTAVLGRITPEPRSAISESHIKDSNSSKYIFPGAITMLMGSLGLIFKRWLF